MLKKSVNTINKDKERIAKLMGEIIVRGQLKVAERLELWDKKCSVNQRKILLILFLCLGVGYCSYLLTDALLGNVEKEKIWDHGSPHAPAPLIPGELLDSIENNKKKL